jgi:zinc transport system permease protein
VTGTVLLAGGGTAGHVMPAVATAAALLIEHLRASGRASGDLALSLFFYTGIAAGVVIISLGGSTANLLPYLFGQIITITGGEVLLIAGLGLGVVLATSAMHRALLSVAVDEEWSAVAGLPARALGLVLAGMTAVIVVAAMRIVGILLVAAMLVLPVASAQLVARSFRATLLWSSSIGVVSVVAGLAASRIWDLAPGGTIVLTAAAVFGLVAVVRRDLSSLGVVGART